MSIVAGVDFGTLSVRVSIFDSVRGRLGAGVAEYPLLRKKEDPDHATQSHADHMRALAEAMQRALKDSGVNGRAIEAIALDTTGSSVIPVDAKLNPIDDYYLWCDHRAWKEAGEITSAARAHHLQAIDWCGGVYSSEWGFAKLLHWLRHNPEKRGSFASAFEHCDMVAAVLCGIEDWHSRLAAFALIKPSGVPYESMTPADMVITDLYSRAAEGRLRPSTDLATHLALYRAFPSIGGIAHTHSRHATAWAQACRAIPCFGTTQADYFHGPVPVTQPLSSTDIESDYEANTGVAIIRAMEGLVPLACPAVLVAGHAPFCWGKSARDAAHVAVILEELTALAWQTLTINPATSPIAEALRDKHHFRKHGPKATYGQRN